MHFYASESTMDNLKSVFNVFWRKQSLGALACSAPRSKRQKEALPSLMEKIVTLIVLHLKAIKNTAKKKEMTELLPNVY